MNDFLTQLITRNIDMVDALRPRPTPLFAPERAVEPPAEAGAFLEAPAVEVPPAP